MLFAETRGAQLLKTDGGLNITRAVRNSVNALVSQTLERGESIDTLARKIKTMPEFANSKVRTIARTETANALGQGQKEAARSQGRNVKRWISQGDNLVNIPICASNEDQGWIGINDSFQSAHDTIPGHINCRCVVQFADIPLGQDQPKSYTIAEIRCPQCNRKNGENVAAGTQTRCRRCKHEWRIE